jgi:hypothetical protein
LIKVIDSLAAEPSQKIVDGIFDAVRLFRASSAPADDMTAVALRITN